MRRSATGVGQTQPAVLWTGGTAVVLGTLRASWVLPTPGTAPPLGAELGSARELLSPHEGQTSGAPAMPRGAIPLWTPEWARQRARVTSKGHATPEAPACPTWVSGIWALRLYTK